MPPLHVLVRLAFCLFLLVSLSPLLVSLFFSSAYHHHPAKSQDIRPTAEPGAAALVGALKITHTPSLWLDGVFNLGGGSRKALGGDSDAGGESAGGGLALGGFSVWGESTITVSKTQATYLTRPAAFGPRVRSEDGLKGYLLPIHHFHHSDHSSSPTFTVDNSGCPSEKDTDENGGRLKRVVQDGFLDDDAEIRGPLPPQDWIALIERGSCSFADKVRVAQSLGAIAVIVGDGPPPHLPSSGEDGSEGGDEWDNDGDGSESGSYSGRLITMFSPGDTSDIKIPSTFVVRPSYLDLERLAAEMNEKTARRGRKGKWTFGERQRDETPAKRLRGLEVTLSRDELWEWPLINLALFLLLLPSLVTLTTIIIHRIRLARARRADRAPEAIVRALPSRIWRETTTGWTGDDEEGVVEWNEEEFQGGGGDSSTPSSNGRDPGALTKGEEKEDEADLEQGLLLSRSNGSTEGASTDSPSNRLQGEDASAVPGPSSSLRPRASGKNKKDKQRYYSTDECAICLSNFVNGDRVRILPCGHVFHQTEVDGWLIRRKKLCPICKRDVTVPVPTPSSNLSEAADDEQEHEMSSSDVSGYHASAGATSSNRSTPPRTSSEPEELPTESTPLLPSDRDSTYRP